MSNSTNLSINGAKWNETTIKIKIDGAVRRIPLNRICPQDKKEKAEHLGDSVTHNSSYLKLLDYVIQYSDAFRDGKHYEDKYQTRITYLDEENEEVTVSSDLELLEAVTALHGLPKNDEKEWILEDVSDSIEENSDKSLSSDKKKYILRMTAVVELKSGIREPNKGSKSFPSFEPLMTKMREFSSCFEQSGKLPAGIVAIDSIFSLVADVIDSFQNQDSFSKNKGSSSEEKVIPPLQTARGENYHESFDPNFIHGRHTCDGCKVDPIVGYRYHSHAKPNYDLCHSCFSKKCEQNDTSEDLKSFRLMQYKPDHHFKRQKFSHRWHMNNVYGYLHPQSHNRKRKVEKEELFDVIVNDDIIERCLSDIRKRKTDSSLSNNSDKFDDSLASNRFLLDAPRLSEEDVIEFEKEEKNEFCSEATGESTNVIVVENNDSNLSIVSPCDSSGSREAHDSIQADDSDESISVSNCNKLDTKSKKKNSTQIASSHLELIDLSTKESDDENSTTACESPNLGSVICVPNTNVSENNDTKEISLPQTDFNTTAVEETEEETNITKASNWEEVKACNSEIYVTSDSSLDAHGSCSDSSDSFTVLDENETLLSQEGFSNCVSLADNMNKEKFVNATSHSTTNSSSASGQNEWEIVDDDDF